MRVPDEAASGKAKVTVSFAEWKEAQVAPATFDIVLVDVSPEDEARAEKEQKEQEEQARRRQLEFLPRIIKDLQRQLQQETDDAKRQQLQTLIERTEKQLEDAKKP